MLPSYPSLSLPSFLSRSCFLTKPQYARFLSPKRATCPAYLILLNFITRMLLGEQYRSQSSSLCSFLHSPVISSLLGPDILFNNLFSDTACSSVSGSDPVSRPYKTAGKIIVLYNILIFIYLDSILEDERF